MINKFSLIIPTLGKTKLIDSLMKSLKDQTYKNFEVIIVNQDNDEYISKLVDEYSKWIDIKKVYIDKKGASIARNIGLEYASGNIIAFPDDDCEYKQDTLEKINEFFNENPNYNIYTFKVMDKDTSKESVTNWLSDSCEVTSTNVFRVSVCITIFVKVKQISDIEFDNKLGVGSIFGSGEETDMLLNLLHKGYKGYYNSNQYIYHPQKKAEPSRVYSYAVGTGALYKKEIIVRKNKKYILKSISTILIKPFIGIIINLIKIDFKSATRFKNILAGRINGFMRYNI